jgi:putative salt-induced outer membrane protein
MKNQKLSIITAILLTTTSNVFAEDESGFNGSGEASFTNFSGNTEKESLYAAIKLNYLQDYYNLQGLLEASNDKQNDIRIKERYVADSQLNFNLYKLSDGYGFGQLRLEKDRFASIDLSAYYILGAGYQFIDQDDITFSAEAGYGFQKVDYTNTTSTRDFEQNVIKIKANLTYQINENVLLGQSVTDFFGKQQAIFESNSSIGVKVSNALSLKTTYKYINNSAPSAGRKDINTELVLSLLYKF